MLTVPVVAVAVSFATASGMFVLALNHTTVAHVLVVQAMTPIIAALLGARVLHERVSARTWATMLLAVVGVAVMVGKRSRQPDRRRHGAWLNDCICGRDRSHPQAS